MIAPKLYPSRSSAASFTYDGISTPHYLERVIGRFRGLGISFAFEPVSLLTGGQRHSLRRRCAKAVFGISQWSSGSRIVAVASCRRSNAGSPVGSVSLHGEPVEAGRVRSWLAHAGHGRVPGRRHPNQICRGIRGRAGGVYQLCTSRATASIRNHSLGLNVVALAIAVVLLGPGALSLDGVLFGRRRIIIPRPSLSSKP